MISEQEAREAAVLQEEHSKRFFEGKMMGMEAHQEWGNATTTLIEFAKQELSRRDAERAERALPITAEWCLANGATTKGNGLYQWTIVDVEVEWDSTSGVTVRDDSVWTFLDTITTRGQLLDLLAALKGGAT